jgi:hypothetical protein
LLLDYKLLQDDGNNFVHRCFDSYFGSFVKTVFLRECRLRRESCRRQDGRRHRRKLRHRARDRHRVGKERSQNHRHRMQRSKEGFNFIHNTLQHLLAYVVLTNESTTDFFELQTNILTFLFEVPFPVYVRI